MKYSCGRLARFLVWTSMIVALPAQAVICKVVGEDGVVGYTDTPRSQCADPVQLPGYSRYAPRPVAGLEDNPQQAAQPDQPNGQAEFDGYTAMQIVAPKNLGTIHNNQGTVNVQIQLEPALQQGHTIRVILDGKSAGGPAASTNIALTNVDRGTHSLSAQVLDENGRLLRSVGPIRFTLRRATVEQSEPPDNGDSGAYTPDYGAGSNPQDSFVPPSAPGTYKPGANPADDFKPGGAADYSPSPSSGGTQSNGINPAFKPNYKP